MVTPVLLVASEKWWVSFSKISRPPPTFGLPQLQRCDGNKPVCDRCDRADIQCKYVGVAPRRRITDALEARALELEIQVADLANTDSTVVLSDRIFEKLRAFVDAPPPPHELSHSIPLFPWGPPQQQTSSRRRGAVVNEVLEEGYQPVVGSFKS